MKEVKPIYQKAGIGYCLGVLSNEIKQVEFYENIEHPGGNSYYKENIELSPRAEELFPKSSIKHRDTITLDHAVEYFNFPIPDLIKMDVQGAELDVLKGGIKTIEKCNHLILELQHVDYNRGAAKKDEVIEYLLGLGFKTDGMFCGSSLGVDGDYYFYRD
jgi:FkbM family methyltransferase